MTPRVGGWRYAEVTPVSSNCPSLVDHNFNGNFAIDQSSSTSFHVVPNDGTEPFTCTLTGNAFSCPNRAAAVQDFRPAVDGVVTVHATATGTFASSTRASGSQTATASCTGSACTTLAGQLPCTFTVNFVVEAF